MNQRWRRVATLAAVVALVAASGCSALGLGGSSGTTILLVNDDDEAHEDVTVEVVDGDAEDGEQLFRADASPDAETDVELGSLSETGEYTLLVTVDDRTSRMTYEFVEGDDTVSIGIDDDGNVFVSG